MNTYLITKKEMNIYKVQIGLHGYETYIVAESIIDAIEYLKETSLHEVVSISLFQKNVFITK